MDLGAWRLEVSILAVEGFRLLRDFELGVERVFGMWKSEVRGAEPYHRRV